MDGNGAAGANRLTVEKRKHGALSDGGRQSSITATFWNGNVALVVVARNKADAIAEALRSMGEWQTVVWSTPQSIYTDLTGVTAERTARKGEHHNAHQDGLWND